MGKGQIVAADFTMTPTITLSNNNAGGLGAAVGGASGGLALIGALAGSLKKEEANTMLTLTENRSGVQVAAAEGSASKMDFAGMGGMLGRRRSWWLHPHPAGQGDRRCFYGLIQSNGCSCKKLQGADRQGRFG
jgi:hypothetical protein